MDFRQLEIFIKIVDLKSFSQAAKAVYLTQPTLTTHMQSLENELGLKLLDRLGREVIPTTAGKLLYKYAKKLVTIKDEAKQSMKQLTGKMAGRVMVGGSTIPGEYLLPTLIGRFKKNYPGITVSVVVRDSSDIAEKVLKGDCELGVIGSRVEESRLDCREFIEDELILIAAPKYPLLPKGQRDAEKILSVPFVIRERGSGSRSTMEKWLSELGVDPSKLNIVAEMGSTEAVKQAVKAGLGISMVSSLSVKEELRHKSLKTVPLEGKKLQRHFHIISSRKRTMSPVCQAFLNFLLANGKKA